MDKVDRTGWPSGPWDSEPDRVEWRYGNYYCLANRHPRQGSWCGYVGVGEGHPWYDQPYSEVAVEVHGGLTFSDRPSPDRHPELPRLLWLLGFDCGHAWDYQPGTARFLSGLVGLDGDTHYRDLGFIKAEIAQLVAGADPNLPLALPILLWVEDGERVWLRLGVEGAFGRVTGAGAGLTADWIRGTGWAGVLFDWLTEHPEFVLGLDPKETLAAVERLRGLVPL